jgi:hypothetical protein
MLESSHREVNLYAVHSLPSMALDTRIHAGMTTETTYNLLT